LQIKNVVELDGGAEMES